MGAGKRVDCLTYAAIAVTFICVCFTVIMQVKLNDSIKTLSSELSSELSSASGQTDESNVLAQYTHSDESYSVQTVSETQTTTQINLSGNAENNKNNNNIRTFNFEEKTTAYVTVTKRALSEMPLDSVLVYSKNSKKLHSRSCPYAKRIKEENLMSVESSELSDLLDSGFTLCSHCQGRIAED